MRVIVTRPLREAQSWADVLAGAGCTALVWPLIDIAPLADAQELVRARARAQLSGYTDVMFVSAAAAGHFFESNRAVPPVEWTSSAIKTRALATGQGTVAALRRCGVPAECIDAPGDAAPRWDSEALWSRVGSRMGPHSRVLVVRGADADGEAAGRDWFASQVASAGGSVEFVAAYRRMPPVWNPAQCAAAERALVDGSLWLISSSQALRHLRGLLPGADFTHAHALATHPRIAHAARETGFGVVHESPPRLDDVVASIKSLT